MSRADVIPFGSAWVHMVRGIVQRDGLPTRTGTDSEGRPTIEIKSIISDQWMPLQLPHGNAAWSSAADRDEALKTITTP